MSSAQSIDEDDGYEPRRSCWIVRDKEQVFPWIVMLDPIPDIDRREWIGQVNGPFPTLNQARSMAEKLNRQMK
jgi:hypothetical protein